MLERAIDRMNTLAAMCKHLSEAEVVSDTHARAYRRLVRWFWRTPGQLPVSVVRMLDTKRIERDFPRVSLKTIYPVGGECSTCGRPAVKRLSIPRDLTRTTCMDVTCSIEMTTAIERRLREKYPQTQWQLRHV